MLRLERIWEERNRSVVLLASAAIIFLVALVDWYTKPYVSLGFLYLFPILFASAFVPRWVTVLVAVGCAVLAELFSSLDPSLLRLAFEAVALVGSGLFVAELARNRRLTTEGQARFEALVETSPAAIVTVDERGFIELANQAAVDLLTPRGRTVLGMPIAAFLPELHHALRWEEAPQFRASMQCQGRRGNGDSFTADVWFSTYKEGTIPKIAAIIAEVPTDTAETAQTEMPASAAIAAADRASLNNREINVLRLLVQGMANKEIAGSMDVSESTVKNTLQQLFAKTKVRTRAQLVRVAIEQYRDTL